MFGYTNSAFSADMPTIDEMVQMMGELRERHPMPSDDVDVLVMTESDYHALKGHCEDALPCQYPEPLRALASIRIESYPMRWQCVVRAMVLAKQKVRVGLVTPPDTPSGD